MSCCESPSPQGKSRRSPSAVRTVRTPTSRLPVDRIGTTRGRARARCFGSASVLAVRPSSGRGSGCNRRVESAIGYAAVAHDDEHGAGPGSATMVSTKLYTIEDLEALPDDGHVYELIDGELRRRSPVGGRHGAMQSRVDRRVGNYIEAHGLGEVFGSDTIYTFQRGPDRGLRPDVSFIRADRLPPEEHFDKPISVVPDLVIEVVSPNDRPGELEEKIAIYRNAGVPLIWVLWPRRRTVSVYAVGQEPRELAEGDELDGGEVLPGFRVAVADLFRVGR